jgi:hypothetical protein
MLDTILFILEWLRNILLGIAVYFGVCSTKELFKLNAVDKKEKNGAKEKDGKEGEDNKEEKTDKDMLEIKRFVFAALTIAVAFLAIGFIIENFYGLLDPGFKPASVIMFSISYLLGIIAFSYFWYRSAKFHKLRVIDSLFFSGVFAAILLWIYYLFRASIINSAGSLSLLGKIVYLVHPFAVSLIFLLTLIIHPAHKANVIRTPLWYLSSGVFAYFLGYMVMIYAFIRSAPRLIAILYTVLFLLSAMYFALGFFAASKKFGQSNQKSD